ncbi:MAG: DUF6982 domain-containing protein [Thermoanaerobaculia bacterium]
MEESAQAAVVLRYRNGTTTRDVDPPAIDVARQTVILRGSEISFDELKAVFFPKAPDAAPVDDSARASIVAVEFDDGEVIRGRAYDYNPVAPGFFLSPLEDPRIEKIFVVSAAVVSIEVEKL